MWRCISILVGAAVLEALFPQWAFAQPAGSTPTPMPSAMKLWNQSLAAVRDSLHTAHGIQSTSLHDSAHHVDTTLRLEGGCALSPTSLAVHGSWSRSLSPGRGSSTEFVVLATATNSHTWVRSAETHNRWMVQDYSQIGTEILTICPSVFLHQIVVAGPGPLVNEGAEQVGGRAVWHLHNRSVRNGEVTTADYYLDRSSLYPVRVVVRQAHGTLVTTLVSRFTAFNAALHIAAPAPPTAPPTTGSPATGSAGISVRVTPNPMPGGSRPTISVRTSPGARCTVRVIYTSAGRSSHPISTVLLGTRRVGTTGVVRWIWHVAPGATGGSAVAECILRRNRTAQVSTFTVFS